MSVTVCIPSIPVRSNLLISRAIPSVLSQTLPPEAVSVVVDHQKEGAWTTRNKAMETVRTKWTAFLDDDDELLPHHLEFLTKFADENSADVVWGWFEVVGGSDPFPMHRGRQWDINDPHIFPITALVRTDLIKDSGARFRGDPNGTGNWGIQDFPFWASLWIAGGKFVGSEEITWKWYHHGRNTSGVPTRI